jgi:hypothetical protein
MRLKRCGRLLLTILAVPLLVITDAEREPGTEPRDESQRRFDAVVRALQWLFRAFVIVCLVAWLWQPPPRWGANGFGPVLGPVFTVHEWLAIVVIGALGVFFVAVALVAFALVADLMLRGRRATAEVVSDAGPTGGPEFRFTDRDGRTHVVSGALVSCRSRFRAGERVPLVYLPRHPETFVLNRFRDKWGVPLLMLLLGLAVLFPCAAILATKL